MQWVDYIIRAMQELGGYASYPQLYAKIEEIRRAPFTGQWQATVRRTIENHSSDSENFRPGSRDLFYSVGGIGSGIWGLRNYSPLTPAAPDVSEPTLPERVKQEVYRVLRDTELARSIKQLHGYRCQICELAIRLPNGQLYAEAHHLKPLGSPHNGPDVPDNILCLCPNHHVQLDYGAISLKLSDLRTHPRHTIGLSYLEYHNRRIASQA